MNKEDKIQVALGTKNMCPICNKIFKYDRRRTEVWGEYAAKGYCYECTSKAYEEDLAWREHRNPRGSDD